MASRYRRAAWKLLVIDLPVSLGLVVLASICAAKRTAAGIDLYVSLHNASGAFWVTDRTASPGRSNKTRTVASSPFRRSTKPLIIIEDRPTGAWLSERWVTGTPWSAKRSTTFRSILVVSHSRSASADGMVTKSPMLTNVLGAVSVRLLT